MLYAKLRPARGNSAEWNAVDPVLFEGELGIEIPDSGIGTGLCKFKLGDGVKKWSQLAYAFDASNATSIVGGSVSTHHLISFRSGTADEWETANGLNPNDPADANGDCNGDGYTNIEKYINAIPTQTKVDWRNLNNNYDTLAEKGKVM